MGADIGGLVPRETAGLEEVAGHAGVDAYNAIYGFLANIRQRDGTPLMDSKGRVTSHLSGLLYRTALLYEAGIKPCYVFDGEPPQLKLGTLEERREKKEEAEDAYQEAKIKGDEAEMLKYAQMATDLEPMQIRSSIRLLDSLGVPWVEAPGEGEAEAVHMAEMDVVDYVASQDYDALLFGAEMLVRNLAIRGRGGRDLDPEVIYLDEVLDDLGFSREELIEMALLIGTDYNDGIHGVGPKTAVKLIREDGFNAALEKHGVEEDWIAIKDLFVDPAVSDSYDVEWEEPDDEEVIDMLCGEYEFSGDRVEKALERIHSTVSQSSLDKWS